MAYTYFAILKKGTRISTIKKKLEEESIDLLKYYSKLKVVKLESKESLEDKDLEFFESIELEKNDFGPAEE